MKVNPLQRIFRFQWNRLVSMSPISELWESKCLFKTERMKEEEKGKGKRGKEKRTKRSG